MRFSKFLLIILFFSFIGPAEALSPREDVLIEYIGHAAFRITSPKGNRIVVDPFASKVWIGYTLPENVEADAVFSTHPHYDHDAGLRRGKPFPWPKGVEFYQDPGWDDWRDFDIWGIEGKHSDPYGKEFNQKNTIWVFEVDGIRIAHLGDNGPLTKENIAALGRIDVLMIPVDDDQHILSFEEQMAIRKALNPKILIPMHYRFKDLEAAGKPDDLLGIDEWLKGETEVVLLETNNLSVELKSLPENQTVYVFQHWPGLKN